MGTQDLERRLAEFRAAHAGSVEAGEALAARVGLRGRSADWLRRLPPSVVAAVRRAASDGSRWFEDLPSERPVVSVPAGPRGGGRMSPVDFVYRTMGR